MAAHRPQRHPTKLLERSCTQTHNGNVLTGVRTALRQVYTKERSKLNHHASKRQLGNTHGRMKERSPCPTFFLPEHIAFAYLLPINKGTFYALLSWIVRTRRKVTHNDSVPGNVPTAKFFSARPYCILISASPPKYYPFAGVLLLSLSKTYLVYYSTHCARSKA